MHDAISCAWVTRYWPFGPPVRETPITVGYMNRIYRIEDGAGSCILRIYENERNTARMEREWAFIDRLRQERLPFALPERVVSYDGASIVWIEESGRYAVLMPEIRGAHPDLTDPAQQYASGAALAALSRAMARIRRGEAAPVHVSSRQLDGYHPRVSDILGIADRLPADPSRRDAVRRVFLEAKDAAETVCDGLPMQYIHGDGTNGNRLMRDGAVTGFFDFEFSCYDVRAMDLAIALGGGPSALWEHGWDVLQAFGAGYLRGFPLQEDEIRALPSLIRVRRAAMTAYFYGRFLEGLENERFMIDIVDWLLRCDEWLKFNGDRLVSEALTWGK